MIHPLRGESTERSQAILRLTRHIFVDIICRVRIEYDPAKNTSNQRKHGVPLALALALAEAFDWDAALVEEDARHDYGEQRFKATGYIGERLYCAIFVDRDENRRIISLRKANKKEFKDYVRDLEKR